ncbi:conserved hypothetical transmembrane [Cryptosporidium sp. chipmunk genotype I]|uniref:conserved hypothetical transmembrane n=1 Tax=Cryptosporidium sp. chipmunk genotype I TaxID=1280935 RepID=UPI00351A39B0|nr:conserved hypothetical transmembrane [Cryptosporidium sp. chipmunk genotype I]
MWNFYKKTPNINSFGLVGNGEEIIRRLKVNKKALLVSGESEDYKGCTNDIIEYAVILSNIYQFKEIRILLSEVSEMLYGNFISLSLNRINGAVVQIVRLSRKSLKEGFQWLISMEENPGTENYYSEFSNIYRGGIVVEDNFGMNFSNTFYDLVFVYCGPVKCSNNKNKILNIDNNDKDIDNNKIKEKEINNDPFFIISKRKKIDENLNQTILNNDTDEYDDYISFSDFDRMVLESNSNNKGNLTCFLDCNYSYLFLSNYTKGEEYYNNYENVRFNHNRISTMPQINSNNDSNGKFLNINPNKTTYYKKRDFSVVILASCSSPVQYSQEIKVCSNNGIGLSIIYRGLFSYCIQSVIRYHFANIINKGNNEIFQLIPRITLKSLIEETSKNMFHYLSKNRLKTQIPILLASVGISTQDQILLNNTNMINYLNNGEYIISNLDKKNDINSSISLSYNKINSYEFPIKNLNIGNKRIYNNLQSGNKGNSYYMHQTSFSGINPNLSSNLMQEINQLRSELCYLKQTINSENIARNFNYTENNYNRMNNGYKSYCPVQIFNSDTIFKKSVKPSSINHHRTFTSK